MARVLEKPKKWFTSDLHWGHAKIIEYCNRPFKDVDHMREGLVERWNSVVRPNDLVIVLGDWAMGRREETLKVGLRLHGDIFLVPGNHDVLSAKITEDMYLPVKVVGMSGPATATDIGQLGSAQRVLLSHFPYEGDSRAHDRYNELRPDDTGEWLLHGHVHTEWLQRGRQINVGVDAWGGFPVSEQDILNLIHAGESNFPPLSW